MLLHFGTSWVRVFLSAVLPAAPGRRSGSTLKYIFFVHGREIDRVIISFLGGRTLFFGLPKAGLGTRAMAHIVREKAEGFSLKERGGVRDERKIRPCWFCFADRTSMLHTSRLVES